MGKFTKIGGLLLLSFFSVASVLALDNTETCRIVKFKFFANANYLSGADPFAVDDNGTLAGAAEANDGADQWYEIPCGIDAVYGKQLYYLKNVKTGKYIYRGATFHNTGNGDWYYYNTYTSAANAKTDDYKWFYDTTDNTRVTCYGGYKGALASEQGSAGNAFSINNSNWNCPACEPNCAPPALACGMVTAGNLGNAYTRLIELKVVNANAANPDYNGQGGGGDAPQHDVLASITFGNPVVNNHITLNGNGGDCQTAMTTRNGEPCLQISQYGYMKADHSIISSAEHNLIFTITYFDEGTGNIGFQYNATTEDYRTINFSRSNSGKFVTATIAVSDAAFAGRQNGGADFRIAGGIVKKIEISRGTLNPVAEAVPDYTKVDHAYSEFTGKTVAGYQGWFRTGGKNQNWQHYDYGAAEADGTAWPRPGHISVDLYPYVWEYDESSIAQTGFSNLGDGKPAKLYDSNTQDVINTHFKWMREYGIDGAALQRFVGYVGGVIYNNEDNQFNMIRRAAEANNRIFYVMYDISGGRESNDGISPYVQDVEFDWVYNIEQNMRLTSSPAYATVGNRPVVCLWGLGVGGRPSRTSDYHELIDFFHNRGCYVIIGTSGGWRNDGDEKLASYAKADMLSPWFVGAFKWDVEIENNYNNSVTQDVAWCNAHDVAYQSVIFSGFSWALWESAVPNYFPRNAGNFLWYQAYLLKKQHNLNYFYIAMFDEYDEGTAIAKMASDYFDIPTDQYFVTNSADGYWLSQDFQLRVCGAAIDMVKGNTELVRYCPVPHSLGPIYYRNSFESNYAKCRDDQYSGYYPVDPCFKNPAVQATNNVTNPVCEIQRTDASTGNYSVAVTGTAGGAGAIHYYKIADVKIPVKEGMKLSFRKKTNNDLGRFVSVDFITQGGKNLRDNGYIDQNGASMHPGTAKGNVGAGWEQFTCSFGNGALLGDVITGIVIAYDNGTAGNYSANIDDIIIEDGENHPTGCVSPMLDNDRNITIDNGHIRLNGYDGNATVSVYSVVGRQIADAQAVDGVVLFDAPNDVLVVRVKDLQHDDTYKVIVR